MVPVVTLTLNPALDVSTTTPRIAPAHKLRCTAARVDPGGGGINVARVIHRLGGAVRAVYPVGGATGERLRRLVDAEQLASDCVAIAGDTRESFSVLEEASGLEYRFVLPGATLADAEWQACLLRTLAAAQGAIVVASGSLPPGVPPDTYARLARLLAPAGGRLVLDASGPALAAALEAGVWLVKPSLRELEELVGAGLPDTAARLAACRTLIGRGSAEIVALSLGAEGALLVTAAHAWQAPAVAVPVAGTIGAGDSFVGGLLRSLTDGSPLEEALRWAMAVAAAALLSTGTALGRAEDVRRLLAQVRIVRS